MENVKNTENNQENEHLDTQLTIQVSTQETSREMKQKPAFKRKAIFILPNLFTTASIFFGFMSVLYSVTAHPITAAHCILISAVLDGFDGKVARLTGTSSDFGIQYDSLADLIAFGMAPAILVWTSILSSDPSLANLNSGIAFTVLACAALRLARFNVAATSTNAQKKFFIGLPSPAAGCTLASFILFRPYFDLFITGYAAEVFNIILPLLVAFLMVSRVRYFSFKEFDWAKKHPFQTLVLGVFFFLLIFSMPTKIIFPLLFLYIIVGIMYTYLLAPFRLLRKKFKF